MMELVNVGILTLRSDQATDGYTLTDVIFFDGADSAGNNTRYEYNRFYCSR